EARGGLREPDAIRDLRAAVVRMEPQKIAGAQPEAAAVRHQVAHRELARHVRVVQRETRQELGDRIVPGELALVGEDGQGRGGERLGVGGDLEQRVRVHVSRVAPGAYAVALREQHAAVPDDGDGGAGRAQRLESPGDVGVEIPLTELALDRARRERQGRGDETDSHSSTDTRSTTLRPGSSANSL